MQPSIENPETLNRRLERTCLAKPGKACWLAGMVPCLAHRDAAGRDVGRFCN